MFLEFITFCTIILLKILISSGLTKTVTPAILRKRHSLRRLMSQWKLPLKVRRTSQWKRLSKMWRKTATQIVTTAMTNRFRSPHHCQALIRKVETSDFWWRQKCHTSLITSRSMDRQKRNKLFCSILIVGVTFSGILKLNTRTNSNQKNHIVPQHF